MSNEKEDWGTPKTVFDQLAMGIHPPYSDKPFIRTLRVDKNDLLIQAIIKDRCSFLEYSMSFIPTIPVGFRIESVDRKSADVREFPTHKESHMFTGNKLEDWRKTSSINEFVDWLINVTARDFKLLPSSRETMHKTCKHRLVEGNTIDINNLALMFPDYENFWPVEVAALTVRAQRFIAQEQNAWEGYQTK